MHWALALALVAQPEVYAAWSDGLAELSGYRLTQPRYGELRVGTAVLIFVKEPFSKSARVKADPGHEPKDVFEVMKLNVVKDFPTGVYDYNLMTSVFVPFPAEPFARPVKLSFSAQEWCGHVFEQLLFDPLGVTRGPGAIRRQRMSYFDGEGDVQDNLQIPAGELVSVDALPIWARGFSGDALKSGEAKKVVVLGSVERSRLLHRPLVFGEGEVSRGAPRRVRGVEAETFTLSVGSERYEIDVELAAPRKILGWRGPDGEVAELLKSARMPYWQQNKNADASVLEKLGLRSTRAP